MDWQSATTLVLAGRQSMRRSGTIAQELLKVSPWMGEVDSQSAKIFMLAQRLNGAVFMDERTNKDQRPRCLRTETAADQERDETRGCGERASNCVWSTALDAFRCQWPARLRRQRGGIPQSTSTAGVPTATIWPGVGAGRGAGQGRPAGNLWQISDSPREGLRAGTV